MPPDSPSFPHSPHPSSTIILARLIVMTLPYLSLAVLLLHTSISIHVSLNLFFNIYIFEFFCREFQVVNHRDEQLQLKVSGDEDHRTRHHMLEYQGASPSGGEALSHITATETLRVSVIRHKWDVIKSGLFTGGLRARLSSFLYLL